MGLSLKPAVPLTVYQKRWLEDKSRFKIGMFSRQAGKSFIATLEAVIDCYQHKTTWVFLSAGERQSKELMQKASMHARAINAAVGDLDEEYVKYDEDTEYKKLEIVFPNGSRIIGLPANPNTARGHSANILLDEFAFHKDSREIWAALYPTVTRGYKLRVISTPQGKKNKFYDLWMATKGNWGRHFVDIYTAVKQGLDLRDEEGNQAKPQDLRDALGDEDAWQQEYECQFLDEATAFLGYDLIAQVEDPKLIVLPSWGDALIDEAREAYREFLANPDVNKAPKPLPMHLLAGVPFTNDCYIGMDIGRKRDLTEINFDEKVDGILHARAIFSLLREPYFVQERILHTLLNIPKTRRACLDQTGIGSKLAEDAVNRFGLKVEGIDFTQANKEKVAHLLKKNFEDRGSRIPVDQDKRNSLHSVRKYASETGHERFDAERSEKTGHADYFWAKGLTVLAASGPASGPVEYQSVASRQAIFEKKGAF